VSDLAWFAIEAVALVAFVLAAVFVGGAVLGSK
jgi:hypothetical protein